MSHNTIAVIFDFDGTLAQDSISFFLHQGGISSKKFWEKIDKDVESGWDPPLAYMHRLLELSQENKVDLSIQNLHKVGGRLKLFPGVSRLFSGLRNFVESTLPFSSVPVMIEFYIVSGGLEEIIMGTRIAKFIDGIYGCRFVYDENKKAIAVKSTVSFTEKTKFLFAINKGLTAKDPRTEPYRINEGITKTQRKVPFDKMIYVGDGPSDVPCFSLVKGNGGITIAADPETTYKRPPKGYERFEKGFLLAIADRIRMGPYFANYTRNRHMRVALERAIKEIGWKIYNESESGLIRSPKYD